MQQLGTITPTLQEFREYAATRRVIPVRTTVLADSMTPIGLYRSLVVRGGKPAPGTFLLESAAEGGVWSRYSFVGARSFATLTAKDGQAHWLGRLRQVRRWTAIRWRHCAPPWICCTPSPSRAYRR